MERDVAIINGEEVAIDKCLIGVKDEAIIIASFLPWGNSHVYIGSSKKVCLGGKWHQNKKEKFHCFLNKDDMSKFTFKPNEIRYEIFNGSEDETQIEVWNNDTMVIVVKHNNANNTIPILAVDHPDWDKHFGTIQHDLFFPLKSEARFDSFEEFEGWAKTIGLLEAGIDCACDECGTKFYDYEITDEEFVICPICGGDGHYDIDIRKF